MGLNMELLNLLNPLYLLSNIAREIEPTVSACDFSQPHTWLLVASACCVGQAIDLMHTCVEQKLMALRGK
jgi:hypothetical protein